MITIKGYEFEEIKVKDSYNRRAVQFKNKIITYLKALDLTDDDFDIPMQTVAMKKAPAHVSFYMWGEHLFYSYNGLKFVDNMGMVAQVIETFVTLLAEEKVSKNEFKELFSEDQDIVKQRKKARETLGVDENSTDFEAMHKNFKKLSKDYHPDMPTGSVEKFKEINVAHKLLKRELNQN